MHSLYSLCLLYSAHFVGSSGRLEIKHQKQASIYKLGQFGAAGGRERISTQRVLLSKEMTNPIAKIHSGWCWKIHPLLFFSCFLSLQRARGKSRAGCVNVSHSIYWTLEQKYTRRTPAMRTSEQTPWRQSAVQGSSWYSGVSLWVSTAAGSQSWNLERSSHKIATSGSANCCVRCTVVPCRRRHWETVCCSAFHGTFVYLIFSLVR